VFLVLSGLSSGSLPPIVRFLLSDVSIPVAVGQVFSFENRLTRQAKNGPCRIK